jgi:hypothetical protein
MLVTFQSKAASEVVMYKEHAKRILDLLNKDVSRGIITAAESGVAIAKLDAEIAEIAERKRHSGSEEVQRDVDAHHSDAGDDNEHEQAEPVSFATRVYPLLEMLRAARKDGRDVMWGV